MITKKNSKKVNAAIAKKNIALNNSILEKLAKKKAVKSATETMAAKQKRSGKTLEGAVEAINKKKAKDKKSHAELNATKHPKGGVYYFGRDREARFEGIKSLLPAADKNSLKSKKQIRKVPGKAMMFKVVLQRGKNGEKSLLFQRNVSINQLTMVPQKKAQQLLA